MKKQLIFILTGIILLWSSSAYAAGPPGSLGEGDGVNSNPHNLSTLSSNAVKADAVQTFPGKETEICVFCHTPHGATPQSTLWSRYSPDLMGSFPIRAGLSISDVGIIATTGYNAASSDYPNGASKLCLSCHDGVTAIGTLTNGDMIDMTIPDLSLRASKINLAASHPVSFVYNSTVQTYLGASYIWPTTAYLDGGSRVQCTTCHQPHQDTMATLFLPFWRGTGASAEVAYDDICNDCHTADPYNTGTFPDHNIP